MRGPEGYGREVVSPMAAKVAEVAAEELEMAPPEVVEAEQEVAGVEQQSAAEIASGKPFQDDFQ
jgi:hypothetical protein